MEKTRSAGLDIIRTLAIVFVVGSHFFLHTSFNGAVFSGGEMFFLGVLQTLFLTNVCLFMMLTGYLNINKTPCRKYYKGALRVLGSYLFFSLLIIAFRKYWLGETFSWLQWTKKVLDYSAIPYAWYIEMWIGLFLLTPFLNVLWRNLGGRRNQLLLIATLFVMGALPDLTNRYGAYVFPGWWQQASFPLIYFFLGCGVREWQPSALKLHSARLATKPTPEQPYGREDSSEEHNAKMPRLAQTVLGGCRTRLAAKIKPEQPYGCEDFIKARNEVMRPSRTVCGGGIILLCLINPLFNTLFLSNHKMIHIIGGSGGVVVVPLTVLVFLLFYRADVRAGWAKKLLASVSKMSLDMYLVSYMFDALYYPFFTGRVFAGAECHFLLTFVTVVPLVLLSSYLVALAKNGMTAAISQILTNFRARKLNAGEKSSDSPQ